MNLPNKLTVLRILLVPIFLVLLKLYLYLNLGFLLYLLYFQFLHLSYNLLCNY